jgi:hypothetical protein
MEVRAEVVRLHERIDVRFVLGRIVRGRVMERRHDTDRDRSHAFEQVVVDDVAGADHADAGFLQAAVVELLHHRGSFPRRDEHEERIRLRVFRALQERRVIGIAQRHAQ